MTRHRAIKIINIVIATTFLWTNVVWAGGLSNYKLAAGTRLGDIALVAGDVYLNDAIVTACLEHGVNTNRDILERRGEIEAGVTSDRARDVAYGILGSQTDPQARAFYLINNDLEGGRFYIHRYSPPGAGDDPFYRAVGEFIRPQVKMDDVREIGGVRLRHQVVSIPQEVREFVLSLIPLFPGQISFYKSLANPAQDEFQPIDLWNRYFGVIGRLPGSTQEITIAFDRGRSGSRIFRVKIPHERLLAQDPGLRDMVFRYLSIYIYNRLGAIGAERVLINHHDGKASLSLSESPLCRALCERFNFDRARIREVDADPNYPDRPYKKMNNYLSIVYETGFSFEYADLSQINSLTPEVQIPQQAFNKDTSEVIGVDIGGSDIKVVAMRNGEVTFYEEESWSPSGFTSADMHIGVIRGLIDKARQDGGLSKIDSIGISVNLAVNNERIADGPLVDGLRGNVAEMERIKNLRDVITGIYGVPVAVANDGDMAAMWAYHDMGMRDVLCLSFGTGLAGGYVNEDGNITNVLGEMGNIVINMNPRGAGHHITMMAGAAAAYLSQRPIIKPGRLAEKKGIVLQGANDKAKLAHAQHLLAHGTQDEQRKMEEIFAEIGEYLAAFAVESHNYFGMKEVLIMGRVTTGRGGDILKARAEEILRRDYPNLGITIRFPIQPPAGKPHDLYKRFGQAIGAAYLGNQKLQNMPKPAESTGPQTSGRDLRWHSPDAVETEEGNLTEVLNALSIANVDVDLITNLGDGYEEALRMVSKRYRVDPSSLRGIRLQIVKQEHAAQIDRDKISLVFETLYCKERVVRELVEEFDHAINDPQTDFDKACHELRTDIEEVLYFHNLPIATQALYLATLIGLVEIEPSVPRSVGLNAGRDRDASFYSLLVRSYRDEKKFQRLLGLLVLRYGLSGDDREVLKYFQAKEQAGIFDLCLEYGRNNMIYPANLKDILRSAETDTIITSLVEFYSGLDPKGNFKKNYELIERGLYPGDRLAMFDAVLEEAIFLDRPIEQVAGGIIDSGVYSREDLGLERSRGPPECEMVYIGGGGWHATDFVWSLVRQPRIIRERTQRFMVGGVYATADDGGRGRPFIDALREHPSYMRYIINMADIGVVLFWATGEPAKLQMIYEDSTVTRTVNVNSPVDQADVYKRTLMKIYGMEERLADEIIRSKRERGDFNPDSFNRLLMDYYIARCQAEGVGGEKIKDRAEKAAKRIAMQVGYHGGSLVSFEDIMVTRISDVQKAMAHQGPYRQRGYYGRPGDIIFFMSNILNLVRLCDREFVDGDWDTPTLLKASTINLLSYAALLASGIVSKGVDGRPAVIDDGKTMELFHEALGVEEARLAPSTYDEGTLATVMEAASIRICDDVVIIGEVEGKTWVTPVPKDRYTKIKTVHLNSVGKREITSSGINMQFNTYNKDGDIVSSTNVRFKKGEGGEIIIGIEGTHEEMILSEKYQEGMTVVKIGDISKRVNTVAKWEPYKLGGTTIEVRSRLIIEQTAITDADETYPAHPAPVAKQVWKKVKTDGDGNVVYAEDDQGRVILDGENEIKRRVYRDLSLENGGEVPNATPEAISIIGRAKKVIVTGMGSLFTSILPNFMCKGVAHAVKARNDIAKVYVLKAVTDIETAGLSIKDQMLRLEESIQGIPGCEDIRLEDLLTHVVLPNVPRELKEYLLSARDRLLDVVAEEARNKGGKPKLSKIPFGLQEVTEEDREFFKSRGIKMVEVSNFTEHRQMKKGEVTITESIHYNPEELVHTLDMIGDSYKLERCMKDAGLADAAHDIFPGHISLPKGPLFWPMHVWHDVFTRFKLDADRRPDAYESIVITLEREGDNVEYKLYVPRIFSPEQLQLVARYISIYIYNRLAILGARNVLVRCRSPLFHMIRNAFRDTNLGKILKFLGDVYDVDFRFVMDTSPRTIGAIPAVRTEPTVDPREYDPRKGTLMGISIGEGEIRATILRNGQIRHNSTKRWSKYEIKNVDDFHNLLLGVITRAISILEKDEKIDCIGIAWPGPVVEGKIPTTSYILTKLSEEEFRRGIFSLGEVISEKLGNALPEYEGVPVVVVNDGNAQGFREMVETWEWDFLAVGLRGSTPASLIRNGRLVDILTEVGNVHIDISMGAARHHITKVSGALQQYLTKIAVRRLGQELFMGDLGYREIEEVFGYIVEDVVRGKGDVFRAWGITPVELYTLTDYYSKLEKQDMPLGEKVDLLGGFIRGFSMLRVSQVFGVEMGVLEGILQGSSDNVDMVINNIRTRVRDYRGLVDDIVKEVSQGLVEELVKLRRQYTIYNILLPTHILGETIGELVCTGTETNLRKGGVTPDVRVFLYEKLTYSDVIDGLERGDPNAKMVFEVMGEYLAEALEEFYAILGPRKVIIYGDILRGKVKKTILEAARGKLKSRGIVDMELVTTALDWTFVGQAEAIGAAYLANDSIMPRQILVGRFLMEDRVDGVVQMYRAEDKLEVRLVVLQKLRAMLKSRKGEEREKARVALGKIIDIPIQDMFGYQNRAHEVQNRYLVDDDIKIDGISRRRLMREMIVSCLLEAAFSNIRMSAEWIMAEIRKAESQQSSPQSPDESIHHSGADGVSGETLSTITVDEAGNIVGIEVKKSSTEYDGLFNRDLLTQVLGILLRSYGPGLLGVTREIEVVEGDSLSFYNTKVQIGIRRFRDIAELFEGMEHEFLESVTTLIQPNRGYGEATILYRNVKRFLNPPEGLDKERYQRAILGGFSRGYSAMLERILELERSSELTDEKIISAVVRYILGTEAYKESWKDFGMDEATWHEAVRRTEDRLEAALEVYDELTRVSGLATGEVDVSIPDSFGYTRQQVARMVVEHARGFRKELNRVIKALLRHYSPEEIANNIFATTSRKRIRIPDSVLTKIFPKYWGYAPDVYGMPEQEIARIEAEYARKEFNRIRGALRRAYKPDGLAQKILDGVAGARGLATGEVDVSIPDSFGYTRQQVARMEIEYARGFRKELNRVIKALLRHYSPEEIANNIFATTSRKRIRIPDSVLTKIFPKYWGYAPDVYGMPEHEIARIEAEYAQKQFNRICGALRQTYSPDELAQKILDAAVLEKGLEPVGKKVVEGVKRTERAVLRRIRTFSGKVRIGGLETLPPAIVRAVDVIGEISENTEAIQAEALRLIDAKEKKPQKYIWLDKAKEDVLTGNLRTEWDRIKEELQRRGFAFVYNKPDGVDRGDIIRLVDPSDLNRLEKDTDILYLSLPYMRASLYIAAEVVLAEGDIDSLMGSLSIRLITELYEQLLGRDVTRDDLIKLFTQPWYILPEIEGIISELNRLGEVAGLFEVAA